MQKAQSLYNVEKLIYAVVKCAVQDYTEFRKKKRLPNQNISNLLPVEKFFQSKNFEYWTGMDGDKLIEAIKEKEAKRKAKKKTKRGGGANGQAQSKTVA